MTAQGSLFSPAQAPNPGRKIAARTTAEPSAPAAPFDDAILFGRTASWRKPGLGDHVCDAPGCGSACGFGLGDRWLCRDHLPADYFAGARRGRP